MSKESLQSAIDEVRKLIAEYNLVIQEAEHKRDATRNVLWLLESIFDKEKASE